jgi:hypothetical protein
LIIRTIGLWDSIDSLRGGEGALRILLIFIPQAFFTPVFTFTDACLALYKHWQQIFFYPPAILTKSSVNTRHLLEV